MAFQPQQNGPAPIRRVRFMPLAAVLTLWIAIVAGRLVILQVFEHQHWVNEAAHQQTRTFEVAPMRGVLYDRSLHELAMTIQVDSVFAVPSEISDKEQAAEILAPLVHQDPADGFTTKAQILARLNATKNFAWIARRLDPAIAERVREMPLKGIYFQKEFKRFYPDNNLAAQVLGYVGTDDSGLGGLELRYDDELHGTPGRMRMALDARRQTLASTERDPEPGEDLVLTIDQNIQFIAERALDKALEKNHALRGTAVVQDPHTGEILALATRPTFNPNDFRHVDRDLLMNRAVSDVYEPGSTFKLVTYSAAIDAAGVKPDDIVDCQGGAITIYGRTIHDDKSDMGMGKVTVQRALERSSDVAAVKMALKLGNEKFYQYMTAYGFGGRSGIELPSETRGLLRPVRRWSATSIGSLAIGQEVGVTPVQLAAMVSTIANGGTYLPPHVLAGEKSIANGRLQAIPYQQRNTVVSPLPEGAHRVISEMTSAEMRKMMEGIVLNGTGKEAALNGYSSGGKTGTAQKIDVLTHTYSKTKYVASFAGVAPISNPAITVAVVIDSPGGASYYGAAVSAPVFREIAQQTLEYLQIPYDRDVKAVKPVAPVVMETADSRPAERLAEDGAMFAAVSDLPKDDPLRSATETTAAATAPKERRPDKTAAAAVLPATASAKTSPIETVTASAVAPAVVTSTPVVTPGPGMVAVPQFSGKTLRSAAEAAMAAGLRLEAVGSGLARSQEPAAGTVLQAGAMVAVHFSR